MCAARDDIVVQASVQAYPATIVRGAMSNDLIQNSYAEAQSLFDPVLPGLLSSTQRSVSVNLVKAAQRWPTYQGRTLP